MFSSRTPPDDDDLEPNLLHRLLEQRRAAGERIIDLTVSNPTTAGLPGADAWRATAGAALAEGARAAYEPDPRGLRSAREAVQRYYADHHQLAVDPEHIVLTASTSESYGFLFKLLCDPGDEVLTPCPSYPLFEHLAALDAVRTRAYPDGAVPSFGARTRAVIAVSPHNPTGATLDRARLGALDAAAAEAGAALIGDEVFADYIYDSAVAAARAPVLTAERALTFALGGLSKAAGLPHLKLGWIALGGPPALRDRALSRLDLIADTYLSVSTPVQVTLPALLSLGARVRAAIQDRVDENRRALRASGVDADPPPAGWYALIRLPPGADDEDVAAALLAKTGVRVFPGYYFDIPSDEHGRAHLVVSLLAAPGDFAAGVARLHDHLRPT